MLFSGCRVRLGQEAVSLRDQELEPSGVELVWSDLQDISRGAGYQDLCLRADGPIRFDHFAKVVDVRLK
jgi:hypothetical protein